MALGATRRPWPRAMHACLSRHQAPQQRKSHRTRPPYMHQRLQPAVGIAPKAKALSPPPPPTHACRASLGHATRHAGTYACIDAKTKIIERIVPEANPRMSFASTTKIN
jgi:hypothetical protein